MRSVDDPLVLQARNQAGLPKMKWRRQCRHAIDCFSCRRRLVTDNTAMGTCGSGPSQQTQHPLHHGRRHRLDAAEHLPPRSRRGETPNIDRIGQEGAIFMTHYAEQSCTPGRNAFFTGMHPLRTGMIPPQLPGSPRYLRPGTPALRVVPARSRLQHRRVRQEPPRRPHRCSTDRARLPRILGLSLFISMRCKG